MSQLFNRKWPAFMTDHSHQVRSYIIFHYHSPHQVVIGNMVYRLLKISISSLRFHLCNTVGPRIYVYYLFTFYKRACQTVHQEISGICWLTSPYKVCVRACSLLPYLHQVAGSNMCYKLLNYIKSYHFATIYVVYITWR